jgi:hypothetical protein
MQAGWLPLSPKIDMQPESTIDHLQSWVSTIASPPISNIEHHVSAKSRNDIALNHE